MKRLLATVLVLTALPVGAQTTPLGSSEKVFLPHSITEAGGRFQLEEINTTLLVKPYSESFEAVAALRVTGTKGNTRLAAFIFNGGRRATEVTERGRRMTFTHVGDFVVVKMNPPIAAGQQRILTMRYTGKAHSVSSRLIRDYRIDDYAVALRVLPLTGNLSATAKINLTGTGNRSTPPRPLPTTPPGTKAVPHWTPPLLADRNKQGLGLVLNNHYAIEKVTVGGQTPAFTHAGGVLDVPLANPFAAGQKVPVTIAFSGKVRNTERNRIWDNFDNDRRPSNPLGAE
jgi:hypothetical protein